MKYLVIKLMMYIEDHFYELPVIIFGEEPQKRVKTVIKWYNH